MMDWFRSHHGAPTDPKWLTIARRAGARPGEVAAIFWALLDYASQHEDRGSVEGFDIETTAGFFGYEDSQVRAIVDALVDKGLIADGRIGSWHKRQPKREDEGATERKRRQRARDKQAGRDSHASSRKVTPERENRTDSEKEGVPPLTPPAGPPPEDLPDEWREEAGRQRAEAGKQPADLGEQWRRFRNRAGAQRRHEEDWRGRWVNWALDAHAAASTPEPNGHDPTRAEDRDQLVPWPENWKKYPLKWRAAAMQWGKNIGWAPRMGPAPGQPGCEMPAALAAWAIEHRAATLRREPEMAMASHGGGRRAAATSRNNPASAPPRAKEAAA